MYSEYLQNYRNYQVLVYFLIGGFAYPIIHESMQLWNEGLEYLKDIWNYIDICYILCSIANAVVQYKLKPEHLACKMLMMTLIVLITFKTFFFFRIFPSFTPIVVLVSQVIMDLRAFMFTFTVLLLMLSQIMVVIQLGVDRKP